MPRAHPIRWPNCLAATLVVAVATFCCARGVLAQGLLRYAPYEINPADEFETDRNAFTPTTTVTGESVSIWEASYAYINNRNAPDTHSWPELLVRYGISERIELRWGWDYEIGGGGNIVSANEGAEGVDTGEVTEESRMLYGLKVQVTEQNGWIPRSIVILEGFTPTSGGNPASQVVPTYAFGWELAARTRLDAALRFATATEGGDAFNRWAPSVVWRVPINELVEVHAEYFGVFSAGREQDKARAFFSPGAKLQISKNFEVGLRVGWGLTDEAARFFVDPGIAWRY